MFSPVSLLSVAKLMIWYDMAKYFYVIFLCYFLGKAIDIKINTNFESFFVELYPIRVIPENL